MIKRLRKRFIRIAMISVTIVVVILTVIVNVANFISTDSDLKEMLNLICENQGAIPVHTPPEDETGNQPPEDAARDRIPGLPGGRFNQETPFSTRYFFIRFNGSGKIYGFGLEHIAAVSEEEIGEYAEVAMRHGLGYGYYSGYRYYVAKHSENRYTAVFLDCYQEIRAVKLVAVWSVLADVVCIVLVYILVVLFSRKAIDPVVKSAESQKQFITDAGHELKTPITVIATSLKVLEMETGKQKWIDKAKAQTERLTELVNAMVELSRLDEEEPPLKFEEFSVSDVVQETAESFSDFSQAEGHELGICIQSGIRYRGDEYAIRQLVSILLDNAIKYAVEDSPIWFFVDKKRKGVSMQTLNQCEEMDPKDVDKLFCRFYRADKSRNKGVGGFGIGLSVARSIAEAHGGFVKAQLVSESYIKIIVELK